MNNTKKNIFFQTIYQILSLILPFITAPYISRVLGSELVGINSYMYSIVNYFIIFATLGLDLYGNRTIAKVRDDKNKLNAKFTEIFLCHLIPAGLSLVLYLSLLTRMEGIYRVVGLIQTLYILGEILNINWFFAGIGEFKITVIRNTIFNLLAVLSMFVFVKNRNDLLRYVLIIALGSVVGKSAVWSVFKKYVCFVKVKWKDVLVHLKPMTILFVSVLATNIYRMIDKTMLGKMGYFQHLGCYEYADKILRMPLSIIVALGAVMLSISANMLAKKDDENVVKLLKMTLRYVSMLSSAIMFGIIVYGTDFSVLYFGGEYEYTGKLLAILSFSFPLMAWNSVIRTQFYIPKNRDKEYTFSVIIGAVMNIVLNMILISKFDASGAAIATVVSYFVVTVLQLVLAHKDINIGEVLKECATPLAIGIIPFVLMISIKPFFSNTWGALILQVCFFLVIFAVITTLYWFVTKDSILISLKNKFFRREQSNGE